MSAAYRTLEDGTRVYSGGMKYRPVAREARKYRVRRPDSATAVRWGGQWLEPLDLLPDEERTMPVTLRDKKGRRGR